MCCISMALAFQGSLLMVLLVGWEWGLVAGGGGADPPPLVTKKVTISGHKQK